MAEQSDKHRDHYEVVINGLRRRLPIFEVAPGVRIAILNLLGDTELVGRAAEGLATKLSGHDVEVLVTAETKSVALTYELARLLGKPWVVLRKTYKTYMGDALREEARSITAGGQQALYLDEKDRELVRHRRVALIDDVVSTGSTLEAMRRLMTKAGAEVVAVAAVLTEGDQPPSGVLALGHLPVFR